MSNIESGAETARSDLAFLRALAEGPDRPSARTGLFLLVTGLIWAFDAFVHWTLYVGFQPMTAVQRLVFDGTITAVWLVFAFRLRWGGPGLGQALHTGATARAFGAACAGVGLALLAILIVFAIAAVRLGAPQIFILYPSMAFIVFGAASLVRFFLWRRLPVLGVALGWFAAAFIMAAAPGVATFIAIAGLAMLLLMALPGWAMLRAAQRETEGDRQ